MRNGYLYSVPKPGPAVDQSREEMLKEVEKFKQITGGQKVNMIVEAHPHRESPRKEDREFIAQQLAEVTNAMAILTPSALSRMVANLFFLFNPAPYPVKMFVSESDAKEWLETVKKKGPGAPVI